MSTELTVTYCGLDQVLCWQMDDWHVHRPGFYGPRLPRHIWCPPQVSPRFWWDNEGIWGVEGHLCQDLRGGTVSILSAFIAITNCRVRIHSGAPVPAMEPQNVVSAQIIAAAIKEHQEGSTTEDESDWFKLSSSMSSTISVKWIFYCATYCLIKVLRLCCAILLW